MPKTNSIFPSEQEVGEQTAASRKVRVTLTTRWESTDGAKRRDENRQSVSFDKLSASGLGAGRTRLQASQSDAGNPETNTLTGRKE